MILCSLGALQCLPVHSVIDTSSLTAPFGVTVLSVTHSSGGASWHTHRSDPHQNVSLNKGLVVQHSRKQPTVQ